VQVSCSLSLQFEVKRLCADAVESSLADLGRVKTLSWFGFYETQPSAHPVSLLGKLGEKFLPTAL